MLVVGGIRPMASLFGIQPSTVSGWRKRGCIPGARLQRLNDERKAERLSRTLADGTVLEISADDLIAAADPSNEAASEPRACRNPAVCDGGTAPSHPPDDPTGANRP